MTSISRLLIALFFSVSVYAEGPKIIEPDKNILFLGDSITQAGTYIADIELYLMMQYPDRDYHIINLGLGSETASGLSERDHPFPRPCIHSRLDRALAEAKPDITFICYGMNDGIYHPPSEEQLDAYRKGMTKLVDKVRATGSKIILLTPPPFDALSRRLKGQILTGLNAPEYGYKTPYKGYDDVLENFGKWVLESNLEGVDLAIDIHTPMEAAIEALRKAAPEYSSGDGIHPNAAGHFVMARTILEALDAPGLDSFPDLSALQEGDALTPILTLNKKRHNLLSAAWRKHVGHDKPGKSNAPPLAEAQAKADVIEQEVRELLKSQ